MTARKPPPWPVRALIATGAFAATPVLCAVLAGAFTVRVIRETARAALGRPPPWRRGQVRPDGSHDACTLTGDETGDWHCITERLAKEAPQ